MTTGCLFLADELRNGCEYCVVVTTAADFGATVSAIIRCDGWLGRTPSIRFIDRNDVVVDQGGGKLSDGFVGQAVREMLSNARVQADFAMLAPERRGSQMFYTPFLSTSDATAVSEHLTDSLDKALRSNPRYAYCRDLSQLHHPRVFRISHDACGTYVAAVRESGRRLRDVKPVALDARINWSSRFRGNYIGDGVATDERLREGANLQV